MWSFWHRSSSNLPGYGVPEKVGVPETEGTFSPGVTPAVITRLLPRDVLVIRLSTRLRAEHVEMLVKQMETVFAGHRVIVLDGDASVEVYREEAASGTAEAQASDR